MKLVLSRNLLRRPWFWFALGCPLFILFCLHYVMIVLGVFLGLSDPGIINTLFFSWMPQSYERLIGLILYSSSIFSIVISAFLARNFVFSVICVFIILVYFLGILMLDIQKATG
jgi:hypothetical protein